MNERKTIRLPNYDYSRNGAYFVTICTQNREYLFGNTASQTPSVGADRCVRPNRGAEIAGFWISEIPKHFNNIFIDTYVVTPDHVHFFLRIDAPPNTGGHVGPPLQQIIQWYKTMTTNAYIKAVRAGELKPFTGRIWQRGYYEHVIRNELDYFECWKYIDENPLQKDTRL